MARKTPSRPPSVMQTAPATGGRTASTSSAGSPSSPQPFSIGRLVQSYTASTPQTLKLIDAYLVFVMATGIIQFVYVIVAGTYPYNAFLAGFIASVGSFVLAANLRIQANPLNKDELNISPEKAFSEFVFASIVLYGFAINFVG